MRFIEIWYMHSTVGLAAMRGRELQAPRAPCLTLFYGWLETGIYIKLLFFDICLHAYIPLLHAYYIK